MNTNSFTLEPNRYIQWMGVIDQAEVISGKISDPVFQGPIKIRFAEKLLLFATLVAVEAEECFDIF